MLLQKLGDGESIDALALDPKTERLESANEEERCFGIHGAAEVDNHVAHAGHPLLAAGSYSSDDVRMSSEIFCGAMNHHIETKFDGLLQERSGERVVDD